MRKGKEARKDKRRGRAHHAKAACEQAEGEERKEGGGGGLAIESWEPFGFFEANLRYPTNTFNNPLFVTDGGEEAVAAA